MAYDNVIRCSTKSSFVGLLNDLKNDGYGWQSGRDISDGDFDKYSKFEEMTTLVINNRDKWIMMSHYQFHRWNIGTNNSHNIKELV